MNTKQKIILGVWGIHLALLCALLGHHWWTFRRGPLQPIIVRTIEPPSPEKLQALKTSPPLPLAGNKKARPPSKAKTQKPMHTAKAPKKTESPLALQQVKEALAALEALESPKSTPTPLAIPGKIHFIESKSAVALPQSYGAHVAAYLENQLTLPEHGEVKMELEIDRKGRVIHLSLLASESVQNSEFLKNRLPELAFPCFNDFDIDTNTITFTISFRNATI